MFKKMLFVASLMLSLSTSANAIGWHCNDAVGGFWKFHADGGLFSGQVLITNPGSPTGIAFTGYYSGLVNKQNWSMFVAGGNYFCFTTDGGQGRNYTCNQNGGNATVLSNFINLSNCDGGLFD
jgi:hypothetical protein